MAEYISARRQTRFQSHNRKDFMAIVTTEKENLRELSNGHFKKHQSLAVLFIYLFQVFLREK